MKGRYVPGGVELQGDTDTIRRVNLESRLASRLLLRLGSFKTLHLNELEKLTAKLDVAPGGGIALDPRFLVELSDRLRPHQLKLAGGDASSDSFCFAA